MMGKPDFDLVVVGGGPAGFFAALRYKSLKPRAKVLIIEKNNQVLQKLLITGGGRCNITHRCDDPREFINNYPRGGKALLGHLYHFGVAELLQWFNDRGLSFYCDSDGCYFPITDKAQSVVDVLVREAEGLGIAVWVDAGMESLVWDDILRRFVLTIPNNAQIKSRQVIVACGGNRACVKVLRDFGTAIVSPVPSLFTFKLADQSITQLTGITIAKVQLSLPEVKIDDTGVLLFTHRGLSGPVVLNLSSKAARFLADANYHATLLVDWLPNNGSLDSTMATIKKIKKDKGIHPIGRDTLVNELPLRVWQTLINLAGIPADLRWADATKLQLTQINHQLRKAELKIVGRDTSKQEYVTCGGVALAPLNQQGFADKRYPGLCYAGEVLDIDGFSGGFNLQNCWTSGWVSAEWLASHSTS